MDQLNYYDLDALFDKCVSGELDIHQPLEIANKLKNRRHEISFLHHLLIRLHHHPCRPSLVCAPTRFRRPRALPKR